ncbi:hypothetical protein ABVK25_011862, partial [Lepraria finkii]
SPPRSTQLVCWIPISRHIIIPITSPRDVYYIRLQSCTETIRRKISKALPTELPTDNKDYAPKPHPINAGPEANYGPLEYSAAAQFLQPEQTTLIGKSPLGLMPS